MEKILVSISDPISILSCCMKVRLPSKLFKPV